MTNAEFCALKSWFTDYCHSFFIPDEEEQRNIFLKEFHTHNVRENILQIAREQLLTPKQQDVAEVIALFHDVGRFPQYQKYKTFKDSESVNHAALGADVLKDSNILAPLPQREQNLIQKAVRLHNVFVLPQNLSVEEALFLKLIRDADKVDIWRVFIEFYTLPETERASAVGLGFPDVPEVSDEVLASLDNRRMVNLSMLKTMNDFKLLQLSWVYDLNFQASFRMVRERDYIGRLGALLPQDDRINRALARLNTFVDEKLSIDRWEI